MQTVALLLLLLISMIFVGETERVTYVDEFGQLCPLVQDIKNQEWATSTQFSGSFCPHSHGPYPSTQNWTQMSCSRAMFQGHSSPKQDFLLFKYFVSVSVCRSLCVCEQ